MTPIHAANTVVPGQSLVDERIVGAQQVERVSVFAEDALDKQLRFALHRLTQVFAEMREQILVGHDSGHVAFIGRSGAKIIAPRLLR